MDKGLDEFRKFLGPVADDYNDAELWLLWGEMKQTAELLLEIYFEKKREEKK